MGKPVVIALYRALLLSTRQLQRDVDAGRTLYSAIRSGAVESYAGVKSDWLRERSYVHRLQDMQSVQRQRRSFDSRAFAALVRSGFAQPVDDSDKAVVSKRIDAGFAALKGVDDQNALIDEFQNLDAFQPKERTHLMEFLVGDVVELKGEKRGVIYGWHVLSDNVSVVYDILPHSPGLSFASRWNRIPQDEIKLDEAPRAVAHQSLLLYFDGFTGTHHIPSAALAARYPSDVSDRKTADAEVAAVPTPSIIQLQSADEGKLVTYLRCNDSTIVQFALASLEGMWLSEFGGEAQAEVQKALNLGTEGDWEAARVALETTVKTFPEYAYAWDKLGVAEYQSGNTVKAMGYYEAALERKPHLIEAIIGLGTCATKLKRWPLVHRAAVQLEEVQPGSETARVMREQAIYSTL